MEIYTSENRRIACHRRMDHFGYSTDKEHIPPNHRFYLEWSPKRFCHWAQHIGPQTETLIAAVLETRKHPEQAYRACLGILGLAKERDSAELETACQLVLEAGAYSLRAVKNLLLTQKDLLSTETQDQSAIHEHVRGGSYYS